MPNLKNKKILVTGGAGFVGSFVVEQLLCEGVGKVVIVDNLIRGRKENIAKVLKSNRVKFIKGDISNAKLVDRLLKGMDYCIHLAALRITHCAEEPRYAHEVMLDGMFNVLESCVRHKIKKLVYASSASIYGQATKMPTKEDHHPYNNTTFYGAAKMAGELMCRSFQHMYGLNYNALRYFNIIGPRMDTHGKYTEVLIRWYHMAKKGERPLIFGKGNQMMDWVYVEDIARATVLALKANVNNEVFNIGTGRQTSLERMCHLLLEVMQAQAKPKYVPVPKSRSKVEVTLRRPDISKAKRLLKFKTTVNVKTALKKLVQWLDEQEKAETLI